jgi:hypothetical protein
VCCLCGSRELLILCVFGRGVRGAKQIEGFECKDLSKLKCLSQGSADAGLCFQECVVLVPCICCCFLRRDSCMVC